MPRHAKVASSDIPDRSVMLGVRGTTIVAVANDLGKRRARLLEIAADASTAREVQTAYASSFNDAQRLVTTPELLYVASPVAVGVYKVGAKIELRGMITMRAAETLVDGPVFLESGAFVRLSPGDAKTTFVTDLSPIHLVFGPRADTVWATGPTIWCSSSSGAARRPWPRARSAMTRSMLWRASARPPRS
ncbi:MAG TPA: hypothetical protein VNO30_17245 [Kofleriaceae bacterium]|nr:hypothetical protein [Kofleriaceae bacterium]